MSFTLYRLLGVSRLREKAPPEPSAFQLAQDAIERAASSSHLEAFSKFRIFLCHQLDWAKSRWTDYVSNHTTIYGLGYNITDPALAPEHLCVSCTGPAYPFVSLCSRNHLMCQHCFGYHLLESTGTGCCCPKCGETISDDTTVFSTEVDKLSDQLRTSLHTIEHTKTYCPWCIYKVLISDWDTHIKECDKAFCEDCCVWIIPLIPDGFRDAMESHRTSVHKV
ncbi:hypothetical protein M427DRAFT_64991 [Gonapodya prolifera JEL478]|uniref:Uncharacterized protein n=1 Tax=Gonapodya prolifera (strain JEL478) TaxID=1344416 RepID=A0A138ZWW3_GONPJ|nr:hypothetical protein M427DRAFT_64991 [Gonapodya prolifera JEL478]|eukprot:KXS08944.1 hypothetical protein M427DRAFT_64991 [Gonapodya prolifera JEL478]